MEIPLTGFYGAGKWALVDADDYVLLSQHSWYYRDGYALTEKNGKEVRMHRMILGTKDADLVVDHINRNRLDNRKQNLREMTPIENANNRSNNTIIEAFGEAKTIADWGRDPRCGTTYAILRERIRRGIPAEFAILAESE